MKVLITSGGGKERIDGIRLLTNISTGKLGAIIANWFVSEGHEVVYLHSKGTVLPDYPSNNLTCNGKRITLVEANSAEQVFDEMKDLVLDVDVVIHPMAIGDFGIKTNDSVKLKSNDLAGFIEYLKNNMYVNPKIISYIKKWNPNVFLVGFKFEVGKTHEELISIAYESMIRNNCDLVVANDKDEMQKMKNHVAYIIDKDKKEIRVDGKEEIASKLCEIISGSLRGEK